MELARRTGLPCPGPCDVVALLVLFFVGLLMGWGGSLVELPPGLRISDPACVVEPCSSNPTNP